MRFLTRWWLQLIIAVLAAITYYLAFRSDFVACPCPAPNPALSTKIALAIASLLLFVATQLIAELRSMQQSRENARRDIEEKLEASCLALFGEETLARVRANVMLPRRGRLQIIYSWNMEAAPDSKIEFKKGQGMAGTTWELATGAEPNSRWQPYISRDLSQSGRWAMSPSQITMTEHLRWIVSVPVLSHDNASVIGILNYDGKELTDAGPLDNNAFPHACGTWAQVVEKILRRHRV